MTARSVSWTDADSVAQLLARATAPRRGAPVALRPPPAPVVAPVPIAPPAAPVAPVQPPVPVLEQRSDNPTDRLDALLAWTLDHHRCDGAFVADDNGLTLAAHGISEAHVALVGPLLSALVAVRSIPGIDATSGSLWLGQATMSWVEARTERGGFCLGAVGPEALSRPAFERLKQALETTLNGL